MPPRELPGKGPAMRGLMVPPPPLLLGKPLLALRENRRKTRQRSYSALAQAPEQRLAMSSRRAPHTRGGKDMRGTRHTLGGARLN